MLRNTVQHGLTVHSPATYPVLVADKDATGFGDLKCEGGQSATWRYFFVRAIAPPIERRWWGYLRVCRYAFAPVRQPHHLPLPPFGDGERGSSIAKEATMPGIPTPQQSHADNSRALSVDHLFTAAFSKPRDPRSPEYKAGVRAALAYRIDGVRIPQPYQPGTAQDDAYYSGLAEGHGIWRAATSTAGGAA